MKDKVIEYIAKRNCIFEHKHALGILRTSELVEIGIYLLENNISDDNVCILAGLNNESIDEVLKYYKSVVGRYNICFNEDIDNQKLETFGMLCIEDYLNKRMLKEELSTVIDTINNVTVFSTDFATFDQIEDDRSLITEIGHPVFNPELTQNNYESFFHEFIETFYQLKKMVRYNDLETTCYCHKCKTINSIILKNHMFKKRQYWVCSNCGSKRYTHCKTLEGMKYFIKEKRLTTAST